MSDDASSDDVEGLKNSAYASTQEDRARVNFRLKRIADLNDSDEMKKQARDTAMSLLDNERAIHPAGPAGNITGTDGVSQVEAHSKHSSGISDEHLKKAGHK